MKNHESNQMPRVLISACLGFSVSRYDGSMLQDEMVERMKPYVTFIPICPEEALGLGTPREVLRLYWDDQVKRLYQSATDQDLTENMVEFAAQYLKRFYCSSNSQALDCFALHKTERAGDTEEANAHESDPTFLAGALLKTRSPSCARQDAKIYAEKSGQAPAGKTSGLFADVLTTECPGLIVEDEGRLNNQGIRERFFTALFTLARFEDAVMAGKSGALVDFHARHKFLLMAYNEKKMREMGQLIGGQQKWHFYELAAEYQGKLREVFQASTSPGEMINVLTHIMGFFKKQLSQEEKSFFLDNLEKYRDGQMPLSVPLNILRSWAIKYEADYLLSQYFFTPFPEALMTLKDSGK